MTRLMVRVAWLGFVVLIGALIAGCCPSRCFVDGYCTPLPWEAR